MDYGIPELPATGGGIVLTTLGIRYSNILVLALGILLLAIIIINHLKLKINEKKINSH
ncbi:MAG: hypothetical protein ACTSUF_12890 [Candidatus Heimdallarchaeaceae archaeon]